MMDLSFPTEHRLHLKREFDLLFEKGRVFRAPQLTLRALPNQLSHSRLGISVGKRHGNAVRRNRIKRLLREAWRLNRQLLKVNCDVAVVPGTAWLDLRLNVIEPILREMIGKINDAFAH